MPTPKAPQAQTDPWEQAAAQYKASGATGDTAAPAEDWKVWQQGGDAAPGMLEPHGGAMDLIRGAGAGIKQLFTHPLDTIASGVQASMASGMSPMGEGYPSFSSMGTGPTGRAASESNKILQMDAQKGQKEQADFIKAHPAFAAGSVAGPALLTIGAGKAMGAVPKVGAYLRPTPSAAVVEPAEMAARKLSAAVLPATKDASSFIKAAPQEVPNVLEYAKRTNNPVKTQLEFSKAAQGNAQAARDFYTNEVLKPNDKLVKTSGSGFGERTGEGPDTYATLSEIDKRIVDINKQLDAPTLNADDARRALATKTGMQAEANKLREILHEHLSAATGIPPEEIANLRQRVGRSYELANDTDAAVTGRMQGEGKTDMGPIHLSQLPSRALEFIRGGPTAIADRAFQRAIKNFPGEAQPLPSINAPAPVEPAPMRKPLAQAAGIEAEPNPLRAQPMSPEESRSLVSARNRSLARREISNESAAATQRAQELVKTLRERELLSGARQGQEAAKTLRKKPLQ